jgi:hypothetical protein
MLHGILVANVVPLKKIQITAIPIKSVIDFTEIILFDGTINKQSG